MKVRHKSLLVMVLAMIMGFILSKQIQSSNALNNELLLVRLVIVIMDTDHVGRWSNDSSRQGNRE